VNQFQLYPSAVPIGKMGTRENPIEIDNDNADELPRLGNSSSPFHILDNPVCDKVEIAADQQASTPSRSLKKLLSGRENVILVTGAGISTSAGGEVSSLDSITNNTDLGFSRRLPQSLQGKSFESKDL
jgi:hypothetical protein